MRPQKILFMSVVSILGVSLSLLASAASASAASHPLVYVVTAPVDFAGTTAQFGTVDLATGEFHQIGPYTPEPEVGLVPGPHGELLSITFSGDLESIDPANGNTHVIGASEIGIPGPGPFDFAELHGKLYATDFSNNLYAVNAAIGAATLIGPTSLPAVPNMDLADESLYGVRGKLFATFDVLGTPCCTTALTGFDPALYVIDPETGAATLVGPTILNGSASVEVDGTFYLFKELGTAPSPPGPSFAAVYTVDLKNGNASFVTNVDTTASAIIGACPVDGIGRDLPHRR